MRKQITLLYWKELKASERNVARIAQFMGVTIGLGHLNEAVVSDENLFESLVPVGGFVAASAHTLDELSRSSGGPTARRLLVRLAAEVFVYDFEPSPNHSQLLRDLTSGRLLGVEALDRGHDRFRVEDDAREICRQFAGLGFGSADVFTDFTFIEANGARDYSVLIRIGPKPFFVCAKEQNCRLLLLGCRRVADLDEQIAPGASMLPFFSRLAPLLMSLGSFAGCESWHNDTPRACFIIDDPLLRRRYGFLDYRKLLELMERERFSTSVAFIPRNYRRSDRLIAELLKSHPGRYSLCVHGCDHTAREFGVHDDELLQEKAQRALDQMALHQQLSGVAFDDVMVFPQGVFSSAAMKALGARGYLAAINTTQHPAESLDKPLILRELLDVAITRFSNFPLFVRRYPQDLAESAFDLFLGKPALFVEHHDYFRDGYGTLAKTVKKLNASDPRLKWAHLGEICSRACLKRTAENGDIQVRIYCDRFWLQNETDRHQNYVIFRRQVPEVRLAGVSINGQPADYGQDAECLQIPLSLDAGHTGEIRILRGGPDPVACSHRPRRMDRTRVYVRRRLCEFRDNYVQTNWFLNKMVSKARQLINPKA